MLKRHSDISVSCAWCGKGEIMADTNADIRISCHCSNCGNYYKVDFCTMRVDKIKPKTRKNFKKRK